MTGYLLSAVFGACLLLAPLGLVLVVAEGVARARQFHARGKHRVRTSR